MKKKKTIKKKVFCTLGLHKWELTDNNLPKVHRMYDKCVRCGKWGKLVIFERLDEIDLNPIIGDPVGRNRNV